MNRTTHERDLSDADLVRRAQGGVPEAFAELVARYQDRVYNACYRMCHHEADALDYTQAAFVKALENLPRFRGEAGFYTWIFRIAMNQCLSHRRAQRRHPTGSLDAVGGDGRRAPADRRPASQARTVADGELRQRVAWALGQIDEEYRAAIVLKDIENFDYAEIAEILEVPLGTVKSRIHRGRLLLRDLLRDERMTVDRA